MKFKVVDLPKPVQTIGNILNKNGYKAYVVGGAVRDYLLGRTPKDWDISTDSPSEEVRQMFEKKGFKTFPMGERYGIVNVEIDGEGYEITTFRGTMSFQDEKPKVAEYSNSIEEDLSFRDLTINALALDIETGEIIDPFGGQEDLRKGIIRAVKDPDMRMKESPVRLLRTVRFATKYNFKLDKETENSLRRCASFLNKVTGNRLKRELHAIILDENASKGLEIMRNTGLAKVLFPGVKLDEAIRSIDSLPKDLTARWAEIFKNAPKGAKIPTENARKIMQKLAFTLKEIKPITQAIYTQGKPLSAKALDITPIELQKLGVTPEIMKQIQDRLIDLIIFMPEKNKNSILRKRVKEWLPEMEIIK